MFFQFGDLFYRQKTGTAMGVPPAVDWANIYFGLHEMEFLNNSTFKPHLYFYKRFVDDVFGIWIPHDDPEIDEQLGHLSSTLRTATRNGMDVLKTINSCQIHGPCY